MTDSAYSGFDLQFLIALIQLLYKLRRHCGFESALYLLCILFLDLIFTRLFADGLQLARLQSYRSAPSSLHVCNLFVTHIPLFVLRDLHSAHSWLFYFDLIELH